MRLIHRIRECTPERIVCESDLTDHWVFDVHFPDDPIFPGSLLIEGAGQAIAVWAWESGMRGYPRLVKTSAKFKLPVRTSDPIVTYHARIRSKGTLCVGEVDVFIGDRLAAVVHGSLKVLPSS